MLMTSSTNMFLHTLLCAACHRHLVTSSRTLWTLVVVLLCGVLAGVDGVSSGGGARGHVSSHSSSLPSSERSCRQAVERFDSFKLSATHAVPQTKIRRKCLLTTDFTDFTNSLHNNTHTLVSLQPDMVSLRCGRLYGQVFQWHHDDHVTSTGQWTWKTKTFYLCYLFKTLQPHMRIECYETV